MELFLLLRDLFLLLRELDLFLPDLFLRRDLFRDILAYKLLAFPNCPKVKQKAVSDGTEDPYARNPFISPDAKASKVLETQLISLIPPQHQ